MLLFQIMGASPSKEDNDGKTAIVVYQDGTEKNFRVGNIISFGPDSRFELAPACDQPAKFYVANPKQGQIEFTIGKIGNSTSLFFLVTTSYNKLVSSGLEIDDYTNRDKFNNMFNTVLRDNGYESGPYKNLCESLYYAANNVAQVEVDVLSIKGRKPKLTNCKTRKLTRREIKYIKSQNEEKAKNIEELAKYLAKNTDRNVGINSNGSIVLFKDPKALPSVLVNGTDGYNFVIPNQIGNVYNYSQITERYNTQNHIFENVLVPGLATVAVAAGIYGGKKLYDRYSRNSAVPSSNGSDEVPLNNTSTEQPRPNNNEEEVVGLDDVSIKTTYESRLSSSRNKKQDNQKRNDIFL